MNEVRTSEVTLQFIEWIGSAGSAMRFLLSLSAVVLNKIQSAIIKYVSFITSKNPLCCRTGRFCYRCAVILI